MRKVIILFLLSFLLACASVKNDLCLTDQPLNQPKEMFQKY